MSEEDFAQLQFADAAPVPKGRPWPRYFARMLDLMLFGIIGMILLTIVLLIVTRDGLDRFTAMTSGFGGTLLSNIVSIVLAAPFVALFIGLGQTPGKWLYGIRVRNRDGSRIGLAKALKREAWVIARGLAFGIPLLSLGTLVMSYSTLKDDGITSWDKAFDCDVQHAPKTWFWWARATFGALVFLTMSLGGYFILLKSMASGQG